ncbi:MAG: acyl-CoA dehydrogenase family protein [Flavobacteriales bacterium]|nr:acyl-CoA dehydrogenase family protein [Flavobacteriales bacterium]
MARMHYFTEEHDTFRQAFRDFLKKEVVPFVNEWEERGELPRSIWKKFGDMGFFGIASPERYGGLALDFFYTVIFMEEIARIDSAGTGAAIGAHVYLALSHLDNEGTEEQKEHYLRKGIAGDLFGCLAITEPGGGSDVAAMRTSAARDGDHYIINGSKTFITNGVLSDFLVVAAKTDPSAKAAGISMFVIDRNTPGITASRLNKLGWHASDTGEIAFDEVRVPATALMGQEGQGFYYIMQKFALERIGMAVGAVAACEHALGQTLTYMREREAFGRSIDRFQVLRHRIAQLASEVEMQKQFVLHICHRHSKGEYVVKEAAMAKLLATQLSDKVATECLQMYGGYGFMEEYPMARFYRDTRLGQIGGGTSEIMCEIIAKMVIDDVRYA